MLNGTLTLHDIRDVEAFCAAILKRRGIPIDEDIHAYLIEETWLLSTRYNGSHGSRFSTWAKTTLSLRLIDYQRQQHGRTTWKFTDRTYTRERPTLLPLDDQLAEHQPTSPLDNPEHRDPDLLRHLRTRDRSHDRPYPNLDQRTTRTAA